MNHQEYLLSFGSAGDFGRFQPGEPLSCRRGDRVVVRSQRGLEIGVVMRPSNQGHTRMLADQHVGQILRLTTPEDEQTAQRLRQRGQRLFEDGRRIVAALGLPMEILDVEVLLDSRQALVHYLRWADCDPRPLMDQLSEGHHLLITLHDLALLTAKPEGEEYEETAGCGSGGCGFGSSGCGSCSSGKCSSCPSHKKNKESELAPTKRMSVAPEYALASVVTQADLPDRIPLL